MRNIPYLRKVTQAQTEYRDIRKHDIAWILEQCRNIVLVANQLDSSYQNIIDNLNRPNLLIPKQSTGKRNTVITFCEGIIKNFSHGQYNLSAKGCQGIQEAFRVASEDLEIETVEFEEVQTLPKISIPENLPKSAIEDFFDIESITITWKSKV